ncbi:MAG: hypothetical protein M3378_06935 [Actinomycetota bacterium]|nr:hypothetical protein [Actinomycetota bacterium]
MACRFSCAVFRLLCLAMCTPYWACLPGEPVRLVLPGELSFRGLCFGRRLCSRKDRFIPPFGRQAFMRGQEGGVEQPAVFRDQPLAVTSDQQILDKLQQVQYSPGWFIRHLNALVGSNLP